MKGRKLSVEEVEKMIGQKVFVEIADGSRYQRDEILEVDGGEYGISFYKEGRWKFDLNSEFGRNSKYYEYIEEPRTYTTSEMIAELEKNPKLVFENRDGKQVKFNDEAIKFGENTLFFITEANLKCTWTLAEEPNEATFMEAVKAFSEGKTIVCEVNNEEFEYNGEKGFGMFQPLQINHPRMSITDTEIIYGKWYIKE